MTFKQTEILSALEDLQSEMTRTFDLYHPALDLFIEKGKTVDVQAPEYTFAISPDGPGFVTGHRFGDEHIKVGRKEARVKGRATTGSVTYSFSVQEDEIARLGGKQDILRLLEENPVEGLIDFKQRVARQFIMGNEADLDVLPTLNPEASYEPVAGFGVAPGLLAYGAPTTQTGLLHGVTRNSVFNWHNQYDDISSFRNEGTEVIRRFLRTCAQQGDQKRGILPEIMLADNATFDNYIKYNDEKTIFVDAPGVDKNKTSEFRGGTEVMVGGVRLIADQSIDTSAFAGAGQFGMAYVLAPKTWEALGHSGTLKGIDADKVAFFGAMTPEKIPLQFAWVLGFRLRWGLVCRNPRVNGIITGGARA